MCFEALGRVLDENGRADLRVRIPRLPSNQPRDVTVPEVEFEQLLRLAPPGLEIALLLAHEAGLRADTIRQLTRTNCDLESRRITGKTKGGGRFDIPMTDRLYQRVLWHCAAANSADEPLTAVFRPGRKTITAGGMRSAMCLARNRAGITSKWGLHDLRRTAARKLYAATGDIRKVQAFLGHRMLWTTCWYLGSALQTLNAEDMEAATGRVDTGKEKKLA